MITIKKENLNVIKRYYLKGLSMREIALRLHVSIDAMCYFFRKYNIPRRSASENNKILFDRKLPSFKIKKVLNAKEKLLKLAGIMLYWAEGSKWQGEKIVDFANSDPKMIKVFLSFLRQIVGINKNKLRVYLYCYDNQNIEKLMQFWIKITRIPKSQFTKPYIRKDYKLNKKEKMKYGLIHIRYNDKKLLFLIKKWIMDYIEKI